MEELACGIGGIFELIYKHFGTKVGAFSFQVDLVSNRAMLKVEVDNAVFIFFVDEDHA